MPRAERLKSPQQLRKASQTARGFNSGYPHLQARAGFDVEGGLSEFGRVLRPPLRGRPHPRPLSRKLRGRGVTRASISRRTPFSPGRQALQSPQGDFVCLLRRIHSLCRGRGSVLDLGSAGRIRRADGWILGLGRVLRPPLRGRPHPRPLSRKLRGRGVTRASAPGRTPFSPERQALQSPQGDFVCLLRRIHSLCGGRDRLSLLAPCPRR
jgi:hypothetical protein